MILFFVIALVAAYSSRNMIFEQKTSANQYQSTQAFEAAEAGVEWALAMLNSGRIDDNCQPSLVNTDAPFRSRYLKIDPNTGNITPAFWSNAGVPTFFTPTCVRAAGVWSCSCPSNGAPVLAAPGGNAPAPAFRLSFQTGARPGVIKLLALSCTRLSDDCLSSVLITGQQGDSIAAITAQLALKGGIAAPPAAALTVGGAVDVSDATTRLTVVNPETRLNFVRVDARGALVGAIAPAPCQVNFNLCLPPTAGEVGTPFKVFSDPKFPTSADPTLADPALDPLAAPNADPMFVSIFGMKPYVYKQQPATIVLTCPAQCSAASLQTIAASIPGRTIWLEGDATLNQPVSIGAPAAAGVPAQPVVIISHGNLTTTAPVNLYGLLYVYRTDGASGTWTTGGTLTVQGAVVVEGPLQAGAGGNTLLRSHMTLRCSPHCAWA